MSRSGRPALARWIYISDTHGDKADVKALKFALDFCDKWDPSVRIAGGDHIDLRPMRRGASIAETSDGFIDDMNMAVEFFARYQPTVYIEGNHEQRLGKWCEGGNKLQQELAWTIRDAVRKVLPKKCSILPYHPRSGFRFGDYWFLHGHRAGVNSARQQGLVWGNCIVGHVHQNAMMPVERVSKDGEIGAYAHTNGCLCALDMSYDVGTANLRRNHGFIYGDSHRGVLSVHHAIRNNKTGRWSLPVEP